MSLLNGLAAAGQSLATFAGAAGLEAMRGQLEEQRLQLASELAEGRETRGREQAAGLEMAKQRNQQEFQSGENEKDRKAQQPLRDAQTQATTAKTAREEYEAKRKDAAGAQIAAAVGSGGDDSYAKRIAGYESGGGKMVPNELGSGAYGPYQFMPGTWSDVRAKNGDLNLPEDMKQATPEQHKAAFDRFTSANANALQKAGIEPTPANLYLAHRFGTAGAEKVIKADENARLADVLPADWQKQNPDMQGQTVGGFKRLADERMKGVTMGGGAGGGNDVPGDFKAIVAAVAITDPDKAGQMWAAYRRQQLENDKPTDAVKTIIDAAKLTPDQWKTAQRLQQMKQETVKPGEGYRWTPSGEQEFIPGGPADPNVIARKSQAQNQTMNNEQARDAGFADRMLNSGQLLTGLDKQGANTWQRLWDAAGKGGNFLKSDEYQQFQQARNDFINAQLRRESGAAISADEYRKADQQYFPQPGDSDKVIEQKAKNRQLAVDAMIRGAGPNYKPGPNVGSSPSSGRSGALDQARDAISRGADPAKVMQRLRDNGINPSELDI